MKTLIAITLALTIGLLTGCDDADIASRNISKAADNLEIFRRIVFYNGITGDYILTIEGNCNIETSKRSVQLAVVCQTGDKEFKKHFLGLSDNVTYFAEQMHGANVSANHYRVTFKPQTLLPDIDARGGLDDLPRSQH